MYNGINILLIETLFVGGFNNLGIVVFFPVFRGASLSRSGHVTQSVSQSVSQSASQPVRDALVKFQEYKVIGGKGGIEGEAWPKP